MLLFVIAFNVILIAVFSAILAAVSTPAEKPDEQRKDYIPPETFPYYPAPPSDGPYGN